MTALMLAGCASVVPAPTIAPARPIAAGPLPHGGELADLSRWWQQFDDPLVAPLVDAAQAANPTLAAARSRIEQARAARVAARGSLLPSVDANAGLVRGRADLITPVGTSLSAGVQAGWELDLFGANRAGAEAAQARLEGAQAAWHDARVAVAAEVGSAYLALRACEAQLAQAELDASSRAETARLTGLTAKAGFQAPANADLARASAAQGSANVTQLRGQCDAALKGLVALTGLDEPALRERLAARRAALPEPARIDVTEVPAALLAQRPDLVAAGRELAAAHADATQAVAQRYPRISLAGNITPTRISSGGFTTSGTVWSLGPLSVTLPIFDGGTRRANADAARARYDAATSSYAASLRNAVREVEEALIALQSTASRSDDARTAAEGFERSYRAVESRYKGGLASLFELEDARRTALAAQSALIDLRRERVAAWISLYRALGGGWSPTDVAVSSGAGPRAAAPVSN